MNTELALALIVVVVEVLGAGLLLIYCYQTHAGIGMGVTGLLTFMLGSASVLSTMGMKDFWQFLFGIPLLLISGICGALLGMLIYVSAAKAQNVSNENIISAKAF